MDRQTLGRRAEDLAAAFLAANGLTVLVRNFRRRAGELDIVARNGEVLVIAEVRTRSSERFGGAAGSVGHRKQLRLQRAAALLLLERGDLADLQARFDVLIVHNAGRADARIEWIQHAFCGV